MHQYGPLYIPKEKKSLAECNFAHMHTLTALHQLTNNSTLIKTCTLLKKNPLMTAQHLIFLVITWLKCEISSRGMSHISVDECVLQGICRQLKYFGRLHVWPRVLSLFVLWETGTCSRDTIHQDQRTQKCGPLTVTWGLIQFTSRISS